MEESNIPKPKKTLYSQVIKRIIDFILSVVALICLSPLLLVICVLELVFHGRPIFYSQERVGKDEKIFKIYKFRSMNNEKDENGNLLPGEKRITPFGHVLRRFSLDELPELFCIFIGNMSIIGPRPLLPLSLPYYTERHRKRHTVKPGLALVSLKPLKTWSWNDQFENDIWYIENISLKVDVRMIFAVIKEALKGSDYRVNDTRAEYIGTNLFDTEDTVEK